jgi:RimJ/RimL family protein N-acetyltransferase
MAGILETERLLLRRWRSEDLEPFFRMNSDAAVMRYFPGCLSREESNGLVRRIENHFELHGYGLYAADLRESGEFAGYVGLWTPTFHAPFVPCVEIGWRLDSRFWNRGLATEGARVVLRYGFENVGLEEIVSFTVPANLPSRRVMEKLGMTHDPAEDFDHPRIPEGHPLRRHVLYRMRRADFREPPK